MKNVRSVVTFRASSIGDALMGKYFLENVHAFVPQAKCYMLVGSRAGMIRDLFHAYPWLTVIEANRKDPISAFRAGMALYGVDFALTQEAERPFSLPSKIFARLVTKRGGLYGFDDKWFGNYLLYDTIVPFTGEAKSGGIILEEQKALGAASIPVSVKEFSLQYVRNVEITTRFGCEEKNFVLLHLFAGNEGREISQEKRIEIVSLLRARLPERVHILLTGGKGAERSRTDDIATHVLGVSSIAGDTTMSEFINLIASAKMVLSLNTGASHIAAHVRTPVVVLAQQGGKVAWWSDAMYGGKPTVLCNELVDDTAPRANIYPPSMEMIVNEDIVSAVIRMVQ